MTNELLRISPLSFFVIISYHIFPHLSSVLDNFFGKIFRGSFLYTYTSVLHNLTWFHMVFGCVSVPHFSLGRHSLGFACHIKIS